MFNESYDDRIKRLKQKANEISDMRIENPSIGEVEFREYIRNNNEWTYEETLALEMLVEIYYMVKEGRMNRERGAIEQSKIIEVLKMNREYGNEFNG